MTPIPHLGSKRLCPTNAEVERILTYADSLVEETKAPRDRVLAVLLWHATKGMSTGALRLSPLHEVKEPKPKTEPIEDPSVREGA